MRVGIGLLVVCCLSVGGYYGYRQFSAEARPPVYRTETVERGTVVATAMASGAIEPVLKVLVGSQVSGTVVQWYADFNQMVKEGDVLAELDQDRIKATIAQRSAALTATKAKAEEAAAVVADVTLQRQRIERAYESHGASNFERDAARIAEDGARAALQAAKAEIAVAEATLHAEQIQLGKTVIRSPIDGVVISRDVDAGQTVAASLSAPTLFTIANDLRHMRVNAAVSETDIGQVREGMEAEFRVDAYPGKRFHGRVTQVRYSETVVDNVVTYQTLIDVDNPDLLLRPGMTATVLFEVAKAAEALVVPNAALRFDPQPRDQQLSRWSKPRGGQPIKPHVYRFGGQELQEVTVELGITDGTHTEIRGGDLQEGDAVVVGWQPGAVHRRGGPSRVF